MKLLLSGLLCLATTAGAGIATYLTIDDPVVSGGVAACAGIVSLAVLVFPALSDGRKKPEASRAEAGPGSARAAPTSASSATTEPDTAKPRTARQPPAPIEKFSQTQKDAISLFLKQANLPQKKWPGILADSETQLERLNHRIAKLATSGPEAADLAADVIDMIGTGDFIGADTLLTKSADNAKMADPAQVLDVCATLARASGRPTNAAHLFARAAEMVKESEPARWFRLKADEATCWFDRGRYASEPDPLAHSIDLFREALTEDLQAQAPMLWATAQDGLGQALRMYAELTSDPESYRAAAEAYRNALTVRTREKMPREWALLQAKLGLSLKALGDMGDDPSRQEAITSFRQALEVLSENSAPFYYRLARNGLDALQSPSGVQKNADA